MFVVLLESERPAVRPDGLPSGGGFLRSVVVAHPIFHLVPRLLAPGALPGSPIRLLPPRRPRFLRRRRRFPQRQRYVEEK
ncbi:unnamed protein product [Linum tenue]|uniref:Uncharacterized protein n=1 Tax=Linum tenue TaxID=586396 RepID=A0AAV0PTW5_9ROSI|nr:unnamed protein product [Linum tenue]